MDTLIKDILLDLYNEYRRKGVASLYLYGSTPTDEHNPEVKRINIIAIIHNIANNITEGELNDFLYTKNPQHSDIHIRMLYWSELNGGVVKSFLGKSVGPRNLLLDLPNWKFVAGVQYKQSDFALSIQDDYYNTSPGRLSNREIIIFLCTVLRHSPEDIGLALNEKGWADIETLLNLAKKHAVSIDRTTFNEIILLNENNRFEVSNDGKLVRARHGHSIAVDSELLPINPPKTLYHNTNSHLLPSILSDGLMPNGRLHVHLTPDRKYSEQYGGDTVLRIDSEAMKLDGYEFFASGDNVIVTKNVPREYLSLD